MTNGAQFWFFPDLDDRNKMDKRPFFTLDLESYDDDDVKELNKFHRDAFAIEAILSTAASLKYTNAAAKFIEGQIQQPDDELIKFIGRQVYDGNLTKAVIEELRTPVRAAFQQIIRERIQQKLSKAFDAPAEELPSDTAAPVQSDSEIVTTDEEIDCYNIVRAIVSEILPPNRVDMRDGKAYCAILADNNNRKPICRLHLNGKKSKYIGIFSEDKSEEKILIEAPHDIFRLKEPLLETAKRYV